MLEAIKQLHNLMLSMFYTIQPYTFRPHFV